MVNSFGDNTRKNREERKKKREERERKERGGAGSKREGGERKITGKVVQSQFSSRV